MSRVYEALRQSELEQWRDPHIVGPGYFSRVINVRGATGRTAHHRNGVGSNQDRLLPAVREESRVVTLTEGNSLGAEKFRLLRARLRNLRERRQLQKLVITSAVPNEGKTLVAMNLAVCLAKHTDEKILLLEGDLQKADAGRAPWHQVPARRRRMVGVSG